MAVGLILQPTGTLHVRLTSSLLCYRPLTSSCPCGCVCRSGRALTCFCPRVLLVCSTCQAIGQSCREINRQQQQGHMHQPLTRESHVQRARCMACLWHADGNMCLLGSLQPGFDQTCMDTAQPHGQPRVTMYTRLSGSVGANITCQGGSDRHTCSPTPAA